MNGKIVIAIPAFTALVLLFFIACSATDLPVIQPRLENASVYPDNGTWDQTFDYTVNCSFSKKVNITLEVYNLSLHDWWEPPKNGTYTYNGTGERKTLTWNNIKICSDECAGTSRYRFKYNGSVVGEPYFGPRIPFIPPTVKEEFKNATVNPPSGNWSDYFNYSVYVNTNKKVNIRLEVFDICSGEWNKSIKSQSYNNTNNWQRLTWSDIKPFSADCTGAAGYKFIDESDKHESEIYYGPMLINVSGLQGLPGSTGPTGPPGRGGGGGGGGALRRFFEHPDEDPVMLKNFEDLVNRFLPSLLPENYTYVEIKKDDIVNPKKGSRSTEFDFSVEIENENKPEDRTIVTLWLNITHPDNRSDGRLAKYKRIVHPYDYINNRKTVSWKKIQPFLNDKCVGNVSFCIDYDEGKGPKSIKSNDIIAIINNPPIIVANESVTSPEGTSEGIYATNFKYDVKVKDKDGDEVCITLYIVDNETGKSRKVGEKYVPGEEAKKGKVVFWNYNKFSEEDANKNFSYYFNYTDGIVRKRTKNFPGPYIRPTPKIYVEDISIASPNYYWWEGYKFECRVKSLEGKPKITLIPYVIASKGYLEFPDKAIDVITEEKWKTVNRTLKPFSVLDCNKTFKFGFKHYPVANQYGNYFTEIESIKKINPKINQYSFTDPFGLLVMLSNIALIILTSFGFGVFAEPENRKKWKEKIKRLREKGW